MDGHYSYPMFYSSTENSPDSVLTTDTSPQRSPRTNFRNGPQLLPKIRCQDQTVEPMAMAGSVAHGRAVSLGVSTIHTAFPNPHHSFYRRATSSPEAYDHLNSPVSAVSLPATVFSNSISACSALTAVTAPMSGHPVSSSAHPVGPPRFSPTPSPLHQSLQSPVTHSYPHYQNQPSRRSSLAQVRNLSAPVPSSQRHSRAASHSSNVDEAALLKHGYPTQYRKMPQYITAASQASSMASMSAPVLSMQPQDALDFTFHDDSQYMLPMGGMVQAPVSEPARTTTLMNYLTEAGPRPTLIARSITDFQRHWDYGWWDIRNLRNWSDFNVDHVMSIPGFNSLLQVPLDQDFLPHPQASSSQPESEFALRDLHRDYFAKRVNAALETTQGQHHLHLRAVNSATTQHYPKPDFIATHDNDFLRTLRGEDRGHLVGIVKAYEEWNTGMRSESAPQQVKYLRGLAQIHRVMREHGCRYGFIITEIELLCVRAGAEDVPYFASRTARSSSASTSPIADEGPKPIFGFLETAAPISLSTAGPDPRTGLPRMTPALALWYLHMLAKDESLPGYPPWKMDAQSCCFRDTQRKKTPWMGIPQRTV